MTKFTITKGLFAALLLTGGAFPVPSVAVAGWGAYAVSSAVLLPYASLATAHRRQRRLLCLRSLEFGGLGAVALLVVAGGGGETWAPLALAVGPLAVAAAVRRTLLRDAGRTPSGARERVPA